MESFSDLRLFCRYVIDKYGSPGGATEEQKAEEFRYVYLGNLPADLKALKAAVSACGVSLNGLDGKKMPKNIRGYHEVFNGQRNIYYRNDDTVSGIENTILHELREMIEPEFAELCPGYEPLRTIAVHNAANRFATAVLLPRDDFQKKVYESGFDVIALSRLYAKSCSQVLLRMGEVLQGGVFFYAALYEAGSGSDNDWKVGYWTISYNEEDSDANFHGFPGFFPRKGYPVATGSLVEMAINKKKAHLVRHITILEDMVDEGLTAMARPLMEAKTGLARVALVVTLNHDGHLLQPQIEKVKPVVIEHFHRHL